MTTLAIVVPCYNEKEVLPETNKQLLLLLQSLQDQKVVSLDSCIYYIDDGSSDGLWHDIKEMALLDSRIHGIKLSRNYGHQSALMAGLLTVKGDVVVSIDADLQDDISVISDMLTAYHRGNDIVFGVREERKKDTLFKRLTAETFYKILGLVGVDVVYNHADYRLMSRKALSALKEFKEVNLFLRGIIPYIGLQSAVVRYKRSERMAGKSKYPLTKMFALALDGITSFSAFPLRMIAVLGILIFLSSLMMSLWVVWVRFFVGDAIPGWASSVLPMYFLGGIQLFSIGLMGEYISKIYMETKQRPRFIIEEEV
ncbi:MAG: glycosyltransferase family 2 protein [Methyloprofundus sp.]|nr:glycosyltransferase family 2 protein [Methyloprofundus sp.]